MKVIHLEEEFLSRRKRAQNNRAGAFRVGSITSDKADPTATIRKYLNKKGYIEISPAALFLEG